MFRSISRPLCKRINYSVTSRNMSTQSKPNMRKTLRNLTLVSAGCGYFGWKYFSPSEGILDEYNYIPHTLTEKKQISPDSYYLRVATEKKNEDYPVPSCLYIKDDTIQVMRAYTPINHNPYQDGYIDLVVKKYEDGSVSRTLTGFNINDKVHIRGPMIEEYQYEENSLDEVGLIAGGTGISPMYQIICRILENPKDQHTKIWLIYGNKQLQDILLKSELDELQDKYKDRFKVKYVLENPPNDSFEKGYISREMIQEMMLNEKRRKIFVCGPNRMLQSICGERARDYTQGKVSGILSALNITENEVWKFQ